MRYVRDLCDAEDEIGELEDQLEEAQAEIERLRQCLIELNDSTDAVGGWSWSKEIIKRGLTRQ